MPQIHSVASAYNFDETVKRLQQVVQQKGMRIFAVIDHQAAAQAEGLSMQPATVLVFGAPKAGTPLMLKDPTIALQLPLKVLITEIDSSVQVVFNDTYSIIEGSSVSFAEVEHTLAGVEKLIRNAVA